MNSQDPHQQHDAEHPTATAPDSVTESVPSAATEAGKSGPNAADPPRAAGKSTGNEEATDLADADLDADEGADAFETVDEAEHTEKKDTPDRQDEDIITLDTPD